MSLTELSSIFNSLCISANLVTKTRNVDSTIKFSRALFALDPCPAPKFVAYPVCKLLISGDFAKFLFCWSKNKHLI